MNIIFDIGKVLIDFNYEDFVHSLFDPEAAEAVIDATWHNPEWTELDRGVLSVEQVLQRFIAKAPEYEREIRIAFAKIGSCPKLKPTTVPMIKQLKAEGHKVFFLSNYFEYLIHAAPWALEFRQYMDGGVFSCFEHEVKPDAAIFRPAGLSDRSRAAGDMPAKRRSAASPPNTAAAASRWKRHANTTR